MHESYHWDVVDRYGAVNVTNLVVRPELQSQLSSVHALSCAVVMLTLNQEALELKYTLMARACALLRHGYESDCRRDLEFILTRLDGSCPDAAKMLPLY